MSHLETIKMSCNFFHLKWMEIWRAWTNTRSRGFSTGTSPTVPATHRHLLWRGLVCNSMWLYAAVCNSMQARGPSYDKISMRESTQDPDHNVPRVIETSVRVCLEYECHANVASVAIVERMNVSLMSPLSLAHVCHLWLGYEPHTDCRNELVLLGTTRQIQIEQSMPQNLRGSFVSCRTSKFSKFC